MFAPSKDIAHECLDLRRCHLHLHSLASSHGTAPESLQPQGAGNFDCEVPASAKATRDFLAEHCCSMEKTKTTYCKVATSKFLEHDSNSHTRLEATTDTVSSPKRLDLVGSGWPLTKTRTRENAFHHGLYASLALHVAFALTDLVGTPQTHDLVCCFLHTNSKSDRLKGSPAGLDEFYSLVLVAFATDEVSQYSQG
jgi:hypothetical protein